MQGIINAIQRFSLQDGPGIRTTVFLKGCPLGCLWCSNPETQTPKLEVGLKDDPCSSEDCNLCVTVCRDRAIGKTGRRIWIDSGRCSLCGDCIRRCPDSNLKIIGRKMSVRELRAEVLKDRLFYMHSGGGVTLSGGEPLLQESFCCRLLERCKKDHLHTVVDTSASVGWKSIERAGEFTDLFYVDIKHVDEEVHKKYVGAGNRLILSNIRRMAREIPREKVVIRIPFIPRVNGDRKSISEIAGFVGSLDVTWPVHLLPYHRFGERKYRLMGREYRMKKFHSPTEDEIKKGQELYHHHGIAAEVIR